MATSAPGRASPPPPRAPPGKDSCLQTSFPPSAGLGGPRVLGTLSPTPSPPGGTRRWSEPAARPQPDCTENLGFLWARGGDAAKSRPGPQGRGQVAGGDQWVCVPGGGVQEGGGKQSSQLQLRSVHRNSATLPVPRAPPPRHQARPGAARCQGRGQIESADDWERGEGNDKTSPELRYGAHLHAPRP